MGSVIYWADVLPNIGNVFGILGFILILCIGTIYIATKMLEEKLKNKKCALIVLIFGIVMVLINLFIPSKKAIYGMYAMDKLEEYVENDDIVKQLPRKTIEGLNKWLDEQLDKTNSTK